MKKYYLITIYFVSYINYFAGHISYGPSLLGCDVVLWGEQFLMC